MSILDRHICNPDLDFGTGLIHVKQTLEVHPFSDSQNVATVTEFTCRSCDATWRVMNFASRSVRKWNDPPDPNAETQPRPEEK